MRVHFSGQIVKNVKQRPTETTQGARAPKHVATSPTSQTTFSWDAHGLTTRTVLSQ